MTPYWSDGQVTLHLGDCLAVMREMPDASVDAIVTDPPAGVAFMGRSWDGDRGGRDRWIGWLAERMAEALRVLKPGGHALVWALPRTSGWTQMALEDAGFEVRDAIVHVFGSAMPKSLNVSKAIDKHERGAMIRTKLLHFAAERGIDGRWLEERGVASAASFGDWTTGGHVPSDQNWLIVKEALAVTPAEEAAFERAAVRRAKGKGTRSTVGPVGIGTADYAITAPATEDAARWEGWGTSLKPGQETWWLARKPLAGTVAATVLEHGTGAINVDGCRVAASGRPLRSADQGGASVGVYGDGLHGSRAIGTTDAGRWPANVVFTHSAACEVTGTRTIRGDPRAGQEPGERPGGFGDVGASSGSERPNGRLHGDQAADAYTCAHDCPVAELDRQSGYMQGGSRPARRSGIGYGSGAGGTSDGVAIGYDGGGASRFFNTFRYQAKAPASERPRGEDGRGHECVKPLGLIRHHVRLITPPGGTVLDLFAGSGPVAEACIVEGFRCVLIEEDPHSAGLIRARLRKDIQPSMFGGSGDAA